MCILRVTTKLLDAKVCDTMVTRYEKMGLKVAQCLHLNQRLSTFFRPWTIFLTLLR